MIRHRFASFAIILTASLLYGETPTVYVGDASQHRIAAIATDNNGNTYVAGSRMVLSDPQPPSLFPTEKPDAFISKLASDTNERLWIRYFSGSESDAATAIALDRSGNIYVGGTTTSPDFPLVDPSAPFTPRSFVTKLTNDGSQVLWSTVYGGRDTRISALAIGPDNAIVVGATRILDVFGNSRAVLAKLDPASSAQLWSQEFYGTQVACSGGSTCFLSGRINTVSGIALDAAGNIYVAGNTNTTDFPTTPGALLQNGYGPYVRKFTSAGSLLWSTYLSNNRVGVSILVSPADLVTSIAADSRDGTIYVAGGGGPDWRTTSGALQTKYSGPEWPLFGPAGPRNAFVAKLKGTGDSIVYSTFIGRNDDNVPTSLVPDSAGNVYVSGTSLGRFGLTLDPDYILKLNGSGTALLQDSSYPTGSRGSAIVMDESGRIHASGGQTGLVTVLGKPQTPSVLYGVASAAGSSVTGRVAPGELISIYGASLGDRVLFGDTEAKILYSSKTQINTIVPFNRRLNERVTLTVQGPGTDVAQAEVSVTETQPEIFKTVGAQAAALNQDGSINTSGNPARAGEVISIWGTGSTGWSAATIPGDTNPLSSLQYLPVSAFMAALPFHSSVEFAGAAPGLPAGVFQINLRLPEQIYSPPDSPIQAVQIYPIAGNELGGPVFIYARQ